MTFHVTPVAAGDRRGSPVAKDGFVSAVRVDDDGW